MTMFSTRSSLINFVSYQQMGRQSTPIKNKTKSTLSGQQSEDKNAKCHNILYYTFVHTSSNRWRMASWSTYSASRLLVASALDTMPPPSTFGRVRGRAEMVSLATSRDVAKNIRCACVQAFPFFIFPGTIWRKSQLTHSLVV